MSDLHGNAHAVRAVLTDAAVIRVDEWWILGDLVALGTDPIEVLELLAALPNVRCIGGNTEHYVLTGDRPYPDFTDVRQDTSVPGRRAAESSDPIGAARRRSWTSATMLDFPGRWAPFDTTVFPGFAMSPRSLRFVRPTTAVLEPSGSDEKGVTAPTRAGRHLQA